MSRRSRTLVGLGVLAFVLSWAVVRDDVRAQDAAPQALVPIVGQAVGFGVSEPVRDIAAREAAAAATPPPQIPPRSVYTVPNRQLPNAVNQDYTFPAIPDAALSRSITPNVIPSPSLTFEGLSGTDNATFAGVFTMPPDTVGDIGPGHYV